jgi:hypothetical protein
MQETWTFDFPTSDAPKKDLVTLIANKGKDLGIFLSYYYKKEGAVAEKVKLKSDITFATETTGSFVLEFVLAYFNACLAINEQAKEEMKLTFEIDSKTEKIKLIGAFWPSREMDEI